MTTRYETEDPEIIFAAIKRLAKDKLTSGAKRISVAGLIETTRATLKAKINNSDRTAITDRLLAEVPQLKGVIHTRARGQRGPNVANDNAQPLTVYEGDGGLLYTAEGAPVHFVGLVCARATAAGVVLPGYISEELNRLHKEVTQLRDDRDFLLDLARRAVKEAA